MHLSLLEHGVYNQLLDWYYLDERPLPLDNRTLFRRLSAKSELEQEAVILVLSEMFEQTESGWTHRRVDREIRQYKAKANQAREAGKLGGRPSKKGIGFENNRDGLQKEPDAKPTANREPLTANREPVLKTLVAKATATRFPEFWLAWPATDRKQAKAKCEEKWKRLNLDSVADKIFFHVAALKQTNKWRDGFEPAPMTYLNGRLWLDDAPVAQQAAVRSI